MAEAPPSLSAGPQLSTTAGLARSPEYVDVYSNYARIGVSPTDLNILFSRMATSANNQPIIEDLVMVRMSPHQLKVFADNIVKTLNAWESVFGTITLTTKPTSKEKIEMGVKQLKEAVDKAAG